MGGVDRPWLAIAVSLLLALAASSCGIHSGIIAPTPAGQAKNVILFIGDGMGPEQIRAAGMYRSGAAGTLVFESFPFQGSVSTGNAGGAVTDSAAAATAMATGVKVSNGVLSVAVPGDGMPLTTILEILKEEGKRTGLVTTTFLPHATPAAFAAHEPDRENYPGIVAAYLGPSRPNVLFGGGEHMTDADVRQAGYTVVSDRDGLMAVDTENATHVCGLFGAGHLPFELDGPGALPRLSEMTQVALRILDNSPDGFFLMVEAGLIDHACHANDIARAVSETVELSNAVAEAVDWAKNHPDTLILVAADHETGGLQVIANNGKGALPSVTWGTTGHTPVDIPIYGLGAGADPVSGRMENTDIFQILRKAAVKDSDR
ncbi:MAG TPA: alkaline phosphatase [Candidatus Deferrimicrobiaceae bacterium]